MLPWFKHWEVTKPIMDLIFTNNLGRQVSLTGKGPIKKKKRNFLRLYFFLK